jgi:hypothetical protein
MLHTYVEEKRVRVRQMWLRASSERMKRTFTVREILSEVSTAVPPRAGLSRECSGFYRYRYATLGLDLSIILLVVGC